MNSLKRNHALIRWVLSVLLAVLSAASTAKESVSTCEDFRKLLDTPPFLLGYRLEDILDDRGIRRIPNIDIDGDGRIDVVKWSCPGQGSPVPADPCKMSVELSSGKKIEFEEYGFSLVRFQSKVYAMSASVGRSRIAGQGKLWLVDKSGVKLVCSKL